MFACNVPEKNLIQSCTGHHSLHPLCFYKRPTHEQHQAGSNIFKSGVTHTHLVRWLQVRHTPLCRKDQTFLFIDIISKCGFSNLQKLPGATFGNMSNCSVKWNFVVKFNQSFDELLESVDFEYYLIPEFSESFTAKMDLLLFLTIVFLTRIVTVDMVLWDDIYIPE